MTAQAFQRATTTLEAVDRSGYYGIPVIHRPHWKWLIVGYFFCGGISGSTAALGAIARLVGGVNGQAIARYATYVSIAAFAPCPPLLILDLGRPARFLNMLRVFRPSSPMSVGSWAIAAFGGTNGLLVLLQLVNDLDTAPFAAHRYLPPETNKGRKSYPRNLRLMNSGQRSAAITLLAVTNGALGFFVAGYTGVLLSATAVPLWSKRPALLGPLFLSSAMSSGVAAVSAVAALGGGIDEAGESRLQRLEAMATLAEGIALSAWIASLGVTARPLQSGQVGIVVRHVVTMTGIVAPTALAGIVKTAPRRFRRPLTALSSVLTMIGGFALRYAVVEGGRLSADDPQATFDLAR